MFEVFMVAFFFQGMTFKYGIFNYYMQVTY